MNICSFIQVWLLYLFPRVSFSLGLPFRARGPGAALWPQGLPNSPSINRKNLLQWLPLALFAAVMLTVSPKADGFDIK